MIAFDDLELDKLLDALPPPPEDNTPCPDAEPESDAEDAPTVPFLFIGPVHQDYVIVVPLDDKQHELISSKASCIPHSSRNKRVLLELNCKLSNTTCYRSPMYIDKNGEAYPKRTSIFCWWCRHGFKTQPIGIPTERTARGTFVCFGNYCSFECAMAAVNASKSQRIKLFGGTIICLMRKQIAGSKLSAPLYPAPHWACLKRYGGKMTIEEFRKNNQTIKTIPEHLRLYPVGFNGFGEKRKMETSRKPRSKNLLFDPSIKKLAKPHKKAQKLYKTNFSSAKLKLRKVGSKTKNLPMKRKKKKKTILKL